MRVSLLLPLAACLLQACSGENAHERGLSWKGEPLRVLARVEKPGGDALRAARMDVLLRHPPGRMLGIVPGEWGDSLMLLEYGGELEAYAAFQELALHADNIAAGLTACGSRVCFRRGRWIGAVDAWSWKGEGWFGGALSLPGEPVPGGLPAVFGSMLQQGRIPGSERILTGEFLGQPVTVRVFAVQAECHGDTAWIYAAPELRRSFADSLAKTPGWRAETTDRGFKISLELAELSPVTLHFSKRGMVGVEECFDENLTNYWLKLQDQGLRGLE